MWLICCLFQWKSFGMSTLCLAISESFSSNGLSCCQAKFGYMSSYQLRQRWFTNQIVFTWIKLLMRYNWYFCNTILHYWAGDLLQNTAQYPFEHFNQTMRDKLSDPLDVNKFSVVICKEGLELWTIPRLSSLHVAVTFEPPVPCISKFCAVYIWCKLYYYNTLVNNRQIF